MLTPATDSSSLEVLGFPPQPLTLEQVQFSGILESIPKKPSQNNVPGEVSDSCEICKELIDIGYDIRLGEAGRATLKREISRRLKESAQLRDLCVTQVCRLKNANVLQLIQMSELTGCLLLALRISSAYWKDYNRKQTTGNNSAGNGSQSASVPKAEGRSRIRGIRKSVSPFPTLEPPADGPNDQYFPELEFSSSPEASGASVSASPSPVWQSAAGERHISRIQRDNNEFLSHNHFLAVTSPGGVGDEEQSSAPRPRRRRRRSSPGVSNAAGGRQRKRGRPRKTARERQDAPWKPRRSLVREELSEEPEAESARMLRMSTARRKSLCPPRDDDVEFNRQLEATIRHSLREFCGVDDDCVDHEGCSSEVKRLASLAPSASEASHLDVGAEGLVKVPEEISTEPFSLESMSTTESLANCDASKDERMRKRRIEAVEAHVNELTMPLTEVSSRVVQRRVDFNGWRMTVSCIKTSPPFSLP